MPAALEGVRVLELSEGWSAAALAARLLGELGADVVKIEPPAGDPLRREGEGVFDLVAAGKRSVVLDARAPADRRSLATLVPWADLLVADAAGAGVLAGADLELEPLARRWPHLVACAVTPFGLRGPLRAWTAGELIVQATSGAMACTGYAERPPTRAGVPLGAHVAGLLATTAMLAALRTREAGGSGQLVDVSIHDCLVSCLGTFLPTYFLTGQAPRRQGNHHTMGSPWNAFRCRDGWAVICALTDPQWTALLGRIGRDDLVGDARYAALAARVTRVDEVDAIVLAWTQTRTVADVVGPLEAAGLPAGPVWTVRDLLASEHFRRRMLVDVADAAGRPLTTIGSLFKMGLTPGRVERGAPRLGDATEDVLRAAARARREPPGDAGGGDARRPLEGVRVLEMGSFTAAPGGTRLLAALGADVIKIEPRRGEPARHLAQQIGGEGYLYHVNNTDKRSVTLEIAAAGARDVFLALARDSDAFVENFAPGTAEAWGIGPRAVLEVNPRLVYCSVSGFGHAGPLAGQRAFDSVIQAMAGVMTLTGEPEDPPVKIGLSVADLLGSYLAAAALLAALRHRDRSGRGQHVDVSMHDATGWLTAEAWPAVLARRSEAPRRGNRHAVHVPSSAYPSRDGGLVAIEARDDAEWRRLCAAMKRDDLADDPRFAAGAARRAHADDVDALVAGWVAARAAGDVVEACQAAGVAAGPVLSVPEVAEHVQTLAREMVITREHPTLGCLRLLGIPLGLTRPAPRVRRPAPTLGAHNAEVYGALAGHPPERLAALRTAGVL